MSLLDHPEAQALLADAVVLPEDVRGRRDHLTRFLARYLPRFYRQEQRGHAAAFVPGLLSGLERKRAEPIASQAGIPRKNLQYFVGCGVWDDEAVMAERRGHVRAELAEPDGVIVIDPSGFPKKGVDSGGVARQWCRRQGQVDHCPLGVFLAYVSTKGHASRDRRLSRPEEGAEDTERRQACHVPKDVVSQKTWEIAACLLQRSGADMPHGWVVGDDEFGRASEFRALLRPRPERYVLDVPCNTTVRDRDGRRPPRKKGRRGPKRQVPFCRVATWAAKLPPDRWTRFTVRDGSKEPRVVEAVAARVRAQLGRRIGPEERLLVIRTWEEKPKVTYALSHAATAVPLSKLVDVRSQRPRIEEVFPAAKGEVGLAHYEVRSWVGWHHHITLSLLALWFLILERRRLGGKNPGGDGVASAGDLHRPAPEAASDGGGDRQRGQRCAAA